MTDFKLDQFLPYQMAVLARRLSTGFAEIYEARFGLTVSDWRVLAHLHDAGTCSVREIHLQADLEKSRVSRAVARLEERGLLERAVHDGDKRLVNLTLTEAGLGMVNEILPLALEYEREALKSFDNGPEFQAAVAAFLAATKSE
ncbi:MAG: MarR family transcriptional regulator [Pseudomonadota bacterium]